MLQKVVLDRMTNLIPFHGRLYELLKYDEYWHRYDGKTEANKDKSLCGQTFDPLEAEDDVYICDNIENFKHIRICEKCLEIWYKETEENFNNDQMLGKFNFTLHEKNAAFLKMFIENDGYDELNKFFNALLYSYLEENDLIDKLNQKIIQNGN